VPKRLDEHVDLFSRGGGVVGVAESQNQLIGVPTKVRVFGYVVDSEGNVANYRDHVLLRPKKTERETGGAKVILCVGTSMNSGKTHAAACCYALSSMGKNVRAAKITGTAGLKDILLMNDCGATNIADFTYFGYPSTYLLEADKLLSIFRSFDMKYGNNPKNYLVIEIADGIFQRETAMLLKMPEVRERIHKLIFCAPDSSAVYGGLQVLREEFNLIPDAISGLCSSSPLAMREIESFCELPILKSMEKEYRSIVKIIG